MNMLGVTKEQKCFMAVPLMLSIKSQLGLVSLFERGGGGGYRLCVCMCRGVALGFIGCVRKQLNNIICAKHII